MDMSAGISASWVGRRLVGGRLPQRLPARSVLRPVELDRQLLRAAGGADCEQVGVVPVPVVLDVDDALAVGRPGGRAVARVRVPDRVLAPTVGADRPDVADDQAGP